MREVRSHKTKTVDSASKAKIKAAVRMAALIHHDDRWSRQLVNVVKLESKFYLNKCDDVSTAQDTIYGQKQQQQAGQRYDQHEIQ